MNAFNKLDFRPLPGFSSHHLQMLAATFGPTGAEPLSTELLIPLDASDQLSSQVTTPPTWQETDETICFVHGLGGSHQSGYLIRLARKFSERGFRVIRINLRNCGSGKGLSKLPYNGGTSADIFTTLKFIKQKNPLSQITLTGFSLGGNIILKMAGENGQEAKTLLKKIIAICPVLDLAETEKRIEHEGFTLYHRYYLHNLLCQSKQWIKGQKICSIYEFDDKITAPSWGYKSANDYYNKSSSLRFLEAIQVPCQLIFSMDDPFIDYHPLEKLPINRNLNIWLTEKGSHMGFIGWADKENGCYWMDKTLIDFAR